jgi:RHS repeat-associated protein
MMAGISSRAAGTIQNKEKTFQGQRFDDELGLNWLQFKWRNHDPQIGRFVEIDPLASKYEYNSTYAFSENKVISHIELEGLEAVRSEEYNKEGKLTKIKLEKNIVVLTRKTSENFSEKKNARIIKKNQEKIEAVKTELDLFYNGHNGNGAKNSAGVNVEFIFNVSGEPNVDKGLKGVARDKAFKKISIDNAIMATALFTQDLIIGDRPVGAAVITNDSPIQGDVFGNTFQDVVKLQSNGPYGKISHEVIHTLGPSDNGYDQGGLLNNPPQEITTPEIDIIIKDSFLKKVK